MDYNKIALDTPDLLALLKQRGLQVSNEREACEIHSAISYFRFACYFRPMEIDRQTHRFRPDATLDQVLELYKFDTNLRDVVFSATRQFEVALRARINYPKRMGTRTSLEGGIIPSKEILSIIKYMTTFAKCPQSYIRKPSRN